MTSEINAIAMFCDDFRQDVNGATILIGVLSDTLLVPKFPIMIPKIAAFARIHLPIDYRPRRLIVRMHGPGVPHAPLGEFPPEMVASAIDQAKAAGLSFAGLMAAVIASPLTLMQPTLIKIEMIVGDVTSVIGELNVAIAPGEAKAAQNLAVD